MSNHVLVIEDEDEIADFVVRGLSEEGFTVERAQDGNEGWRLLQLKSWGVILLDWWLPGLDGIALLRRFRKVNSSTPVLFLTARDAVSDRVRGLESGADDYLCKPFAFDELLARIRVLQRRQDRPLITVLTHADLTVDLSTQRVERDGNGRRNFLALLVVLSANQQERIARGRFGHDHHRRQLGVDISSFFAHLGQLLIEPLDRRRNLIAIVVCQFGVLLPAALGGRDG